MFDTTQSVERPVFFDGQELYADDLQGLAEFQRAMRWLHNSSLHQPGIGNGFAVAGRRGDREMRVDPGYALDAAGREIVLLELHTEPVPPVASDTDGGPVAFDLTVSYPGDDDLEEAETREGICLPRGAVRLREKPVFCWVRLVRDVTGRLVAVDLRHRADLEAARKIALARAHVRNCKLVADVSIAERRNARPGPCPNLACGQVSPVNWDNWQAFGVVASVDTREAGFRLVPTYTARVQGDRPLFVPAPVIVVEVAAPAAPAAAAAADEGPTVALLDVPAFVTSPTREGFMCFVPVISLGASLEELGTQHLLEEANTHWGITWMGVEP